MVVGFVRMVSEVPLMYGTVAIVTVVGLVFVELGPLIKSWL